MLVEASTPIGRGDRFIAELVQQVDDAEDPRGEQDRPRATAERSPSTSRSRPPSSASSTPTCRCRPSPATGVDALVGELEARLPEGPHYYPDGVITDQPETFLAAELLREQLLRMARDELPHSITVIAEEIEPDDDEERAAEADERDEPDDGGILRFGRGSSSSGSRRRGS